FAIGIEAGDERTIHDLPGKQRPFERHNDEITPQFVGRIAHPNNRATTVPIEGSCGANDEIVVSLPSENVTGIRSFESNRDGFEIHAVYVEDVSIAQIE